MRTAKLSAAAIAAIFLTIFLSCESVRDSVKELEKSLGIQTIASDERVKSVAKSAEAVAKSFEDITPEQEYYIGRAVSATILDKYEPYTEESANEYINILGQALALFSKRPETFGGYHFLILDTEEINAFAAPGGFIFISRGLLRCANSEDGVASVLAHEIGHVQEKHGLKAIKKSRITSALAMLAKTTAETVMTSEELDQLTSIFEDTILDITTTLIDSGYSMAQERVADLDAVEILKSAGYDPRALIDVLWVMDAKLEPGGKGFGKTHPDPEDRIKYIEKEIGSYKPPPPSGEKRKERFTAFMESL